MNAVETSSTRPYLVRALYEWCSDNGLTPYVAVSVDDSVQVPNEYVNNGEIVLNISMDATSSLKLGNEFIEFRARFGGTARNIVVPIGRVVAIYARENGEGMAFPHPVVEKNGVALADRPVGVSAVHITSTSVPHPVGSVDENNEPPPSPRGARPALKRIK